MSARTLPGPTGKVTVPALHALKERGVPISAVTAYDYPSAALVDAAGVDLVLVGDSLASVVLGYENTLPVSFEEMLVCLRAVRRGLRRALLVADLPFAASHGRPIDDIVGSAVQYVQAGAEAVKLEGGRRRLELVRALVDADVPVMGHIGLTPQAIHRMGGYRVQGRSVEAARELQEDAMALEDAGAFSIVLEGMPSEVAAHITRKLAVPTIGIGAGVKCDGQILVLSDLLGLTVPPPPEGPRVEDTRHPRFVRQYADLRSVILEAVGHYVADVRARAFPSAEESYTGLGAGKPRVASR